MNIFEELYYGNIAEIARRDPISKTMRAKEDRAYNALKSCLPEDKQGLVDDFYDIVTDIFGNAMCEKYIRGIKIGLLLGVGTHDLPLE